MVFIIQFLLIFRQIYLVVFNIFDVIVNDIGFSTSISSGLLPVYRNTIVLYIDRSGFASKALVDNIFSKFWFPDFEIKLIMYSHKVVQESNERMCVKPLVLYLTDGKGSLNSDFNYSCQLF